MNKKAIDLKKILEKPKYRKNLLVLLLLIIGLLASLAYNGGKYIFKNKAVGTGEIKVTLDPVSVTKSVGDPAFTVNVKLTNSTTTTKQIRVAGTDIDTSLNAVNFFDISNVKCSSNLSSTAKAQVVNNKILLSCFIPGGNNPLIIQPTASTILGSFDLTVKSNAPTGQATFSFARTNIPQADTSQDISDGGTTSVYTVNGSTVTPTLTVTPGGSTLTPTSSPTPSSTPSPIDMTLNFKLKFQGIIQVPAASSNKLKVKITLIGSKLITSITQNIDFVADNQAIWLGKGTFKALASNDYRILVKGPKHLQKRICDLKPTESQSGGYECINGNITLDKNDVSLDFSGIYLLSGDLSPQNGIVDSYDLSLIRNNLGKTDASLVKLTDINLDGIVDSQDFSLAIETLAIVNEDEI